MKLIETSDAALPAGHYSQAVVANGLVFVSGQLPIVPGAGTLPHIPIGIEAQVRQVFMNVQNILRAAGSSLNQLVSVQIFIPDMMLWETVNLLYAEILGTHKPARTVIPCGALHHGALIEINAVAVICIDSN